MCAWCLYMPVCFTLTFLVMLHFMFLKWPYVTWIDGSLIYLYFVIYIYLAVCDFHTKKVDVSLCLMFLCGYCPVPNVAVQQLLIYMPANFIAALDILNFWNSFCYDGQFTFWQFSAKLEVHFYFNFAKCLYRQLECILLQFCVAFTFSFMNTKLVCHVYSTLFILHLLLNVCGWERCFFHWLCCWICWWSFSRAVHGLS